jgi:hypothetical protein
VLNLWAMTAMKQLSIAGGVAAVSTAAPDVQQWLLSADSHLLPPDQWPESVPDAKIQCSYDSWVSVAVTLFRRGVVETIGLDDVFAVDGVPVLNGAFSIDKKCS